MATQSPSRCSQCGGCACHESRSFRCGCEVYGSQRDCISLVPLSELTTREAHSQIKRKRDRIAELSPIRNMSKEDIAELSIRVKKILWKIDDHATNLMFEYHADKLFRRRLWAELYTAIETYEKILELQIQKQVGARS